MLPVPAKDAIVSGRNDRTIRREKVSSDETLKANVYLVRMTHVVYVGKRPEDGNISYMATWPSAMGRSLSRSLKRMGVSGRDLPPSIGIRRARVLDWKRKEGGKRRNERDCLCT